MPCYRRSIWRARERCEAFPMRTTQSRVHLSVRWYGWRKCTMQRKVLGCGTIDLWLCDNSRARERALRLEVSGFTLTVSWRDFHRHQVGCTLWLYLWCCWDIISFCVRRADAANLGDSMFDIIMRGDMCRCTRIAIGRAAGLEQGKVFWVEIGPYESLVEIRPQESLYSPIVLHYIGEGSLCSLDLSFRVFVLVFYS